MYHIVSVRRQSIAPQSSFIFLTLILLLGWIPPGRAEPPQVGMVRTALPSVVGIGIDGRGAMPYGFSPQKLERLEQLFKYDREEFEQRAKPRFSQQDGAPSIEQIRVIGSGFFSDPNGLVITAFHVVEGQREVYVIDHQNQVFRARVQQTSAADDLAVLTVETPEPMTFATLPLATGTPQIAEPVIAIGNPFGFTFTVTSGIVSALNRSIPNGTEGLIQTDTPINPGNSGGPLLNMAGTVIGVNHAILSSSMQGRPGFIGLGFAVPIERATPLLEAARQAQAR